MYFLIQKDSMQTQDEFMCANDKMIHYTHLDDVYKSIRIIYSFDFQRKLIIYFFKIPF